MLIFGNLEKQRSEIFERYEEIVKEIYRNRLRSFKRSFKRSFEVAVTNRNPRKLKR